jgi:hypothetical protein
MKKNMKRGFELDYLLIPLSKRFVDLLQDRIWTPLGPQSHVYQMGTILGNVFIPFSSSQIEVSHELQSYN